MPYRHGRTDTSLPPGVTLLRLLPGSWEVRQNGQYLGLVRIVVDSSGSARRWKAVGIGRAGSSYHENRSSAVREVVRLTTPTQEGTDVC